jgi:hypothetical protein
MSSVHWSAGVTSALRQQALTDLGKTIRDGLLASDGFLLMRPRSRPLAFLRWLARFWARGSALATRHSARSSWMGLMVPAAWPNHK